MQVLLEEVKYLFSFLEALLNYLFIMFHSFQKREQRFLALFYYSSTAANIVIFFFHAHPLDYTVPEIYPSFHLCRLQSMSVAKENKFCNVNYIWYSNKS